MVLDYKCQCKTCTHYLKSTQIFFNDRWITVTFWKVLQKKKKQLALIELDGSSFTWILGTALVSSELWRSKVFRTRDGIIHGNCLCASFLNNHKGYGLLSCVLSPSYLQHIYCASEYTQQEEISLNYVEDFNMNRIIQHLEHH